MSGLLEVVEGSAGDARRRYSLPPGHAEVLLGEDSPYYMAPWPSSWSPASSRLRGARGLPDRPGVPYADYGPDIREGQERFTRPLFDNLLGGRVVPGGARHPRSSAGGPTLPVSPTSPAVRVGRAWRSPAPIRKSGWTASTSTPPRSSRRRNSGGAAASRTGCEFSCRDAADSMLSARYDLVTMFEALHDLTHPVEVLTVRPQAPVTGREPARGRREDGRTLRRGRRGRGAAVLRDERACTASRWEWWATTRPGRAP